MIFLKDIEELCKQDNIPFVPSMYEYYCKKKKSKEIGFKKYKSVLRLPAFKDFTFKDSDFLEKRFKEVYEDARKLLL